MKILHKEIAVKTKGETDIINITSNVEDLLEESGLSNGSILLFVRGSTGSLTTIEYEPNLVNDMKEAFERLIPKEMEYAHTRTWGDFNGHSHVRASLLGPSLQVPFINKKLQLGTWQQIVLIDFDTSPRHRDILAQFTGE
ncbi:MAG: secondary thiamine-phosphate synthase enzyme YjbQ [Candidatus Omnitrophota bacterium]